MKAQFKVPKPKKQETCQAKNEKERKLYIEKGWKPIKKGDFTLTHAKKSWALFEEEVYLFFRDALKFTMTEKGKYFGKNQVDVAAGIDEILLIIECKTKEEPGLKSIKSYIRTVAGKQKSIDKAVTAEYGGKYKIIKHILVLRDIDYSQADQQYAHDSDVYIWGEKYFLIMQHLFTVLGPLSRNYFLKELDIKDIHITEGKDRYYRTTALRLRTKGLSIYTFLLPAEDLLKLTYVARVESGKPEMYQRLVSKSRLNQIAEKFLKEGNIFKNNIIVSIEDLPKPIKERGAIDSVGDDEEKADVVSIKIPKKYVSLWVVDGQHRLLSFTRTPELAKKRHLLVTAIEDVDNSEQAKTFVDINQNQKPVDSNVLWDLFDALRPNTEWGAISNVVKLLNSDKTSVFKTKIYIPSISRRPRSTYNLFFSNFCKGLLDRNILDQDSDVSLVHLFKDRDYCPKETKLVAIEINKYFRLLEKIAKRSKKLNWINGFILTNNGLNVFLRVFVQCLAYYHNKIDYNDLEKVFSKSLKKYFIEKASLIDELRKKTSSEGTREDVAYEIIFIINAVRRTFAERYIIQKNKNLNESDIYRVYSSFEKSLRRFIEKKLKKTTTNWWKERIPDDVRTIAEGKYEKGQSENPFIASKPKSKMECLDFMDYPRIITRKDNWNEVFKKYFKDEEALKVHFKENKDIRNKIAHPVDLTDEERDEFMKFCKKIIRIIKHV